MLIWITSEPFPASMDTRNAADQAGAEIICYDIPDRWSDRIPVGTTGLFNLELDAQPEFPPLEGVAVLATLLVVVGVLTLEDAAAACHEDTAHIVHEAEAWSLGQA